MAIAMSVKTVGISVVIGGAFTGAAAFAGATRTIATIGAAIEKLNARKTQLDIDYSSVLAAERQIIKAEHLVSDIEARKAKLTVGSDEWNRANNMLGRAQKQLDALRDKRTKLTIDATAAERAKRQLEELGTIQAKLNANNNKFAELENKRAAFRASIMDKVALGATIAAPIKVAIDFESAMADVKKVVNFSDELDFKSFNDQILSLSRTIPLSASELAQITASGGQLGIAKENLLGFTQTVAKMSTAFDMAAGEAGESIAKLMNVYGLELGEIGNLGDAINHLSDNSAAKASSVVEAMGRIGGTAKMFGLSAEQAAALSNAFISLGKPPQVAATSINALLIKLKTAPQQGKKFQEALEAMGLDAEQLSDDINTDAQGALTNFLETIAQVDNSERMGLLSDMFGSEYADDIALITGSLDQYRKALDLTSEKEKYAGSMQREFENRSATTANNLTLLKSGFTEIGINIGSVILPALNMLIGGLRGLVNWGASIAAEFPLITKIIGGFITGAVGLSIALSAVGYAATFVVGGFIHLKNMYLGIKGAIIYVKAGLLAERIAHIGATLSAYRHSIALKLSAAWTWAHTTAIKVWTAATAFGGGVIKALTSGLIFQRAAMIGSAIATKALAAVQWLWNAALLANPIGLVVAAVVGAVALIYAYWEPISNFFVGIWEGIKSAFAPSMEFWSSMIGAWTAPFQAFFGWISDSIGWVAEKIGALIDWFASDDETKEINATKSVEVGALAHTLPTFEQNALEPIALTPAPLYDQGALQPIALRQTPLEFGGGYTETPLPQEIAQSAATIANNNAYNSAPSINIVINNPQVASAAQTDALKTDVRRAVDEALRARAEKERDLTFRDQDERW
jgi:TP901 family phage tail tape measure protein